MSNKKPDRSVENAQEPAEPELPPGAAEAIQAMQDEVNKAAAEGAMNAQMQCLAQKVHELTVEKYQLLARLDGKDAHDSSA